MEWRCEWCGKPHEENDPPCDNCGHGSFEKAVVRRTDLSESDAEASTVVWVCTECGREHTRNSPPCSRCNNATLEREKKTLSDDDLTAGPNSGKRSSTSTDSTTVWLCTECGREHTKHSPPCSRCGAPDLERQTKEIDAGELASPSYVDLLTPRYALALVGVLALATAFVLGATGVVNVPFLFPGDSLPAVENVPGNESETASGVSTAEIEDAYVEAVNDQREQRDLSRLDRNGRLDDLVRVYNQQLIKEEFEGTAENTEQTVQLLEEECRNGGVISLSVERDTGETSASELGDRLAEGVFSGATAGGAAEQQADGEFSTIGVDVHEIQGELYLRQVLCA